MSEQVRIPIENRGIPFRSLNQWVLHRKSSEDIPDPSENLIQFVDKHVKNKFATSVAESRFRSELGRVEVFLNHSWLTPVSDTFAGIMETFTHNGWPLTLPIFICAFLLDQNRVEEELGLDFMYGPFIRAMNVMHHFITFVGDDGYLFTRGFSVFEEIYATRKQTDIILVTRYGPLDSPKVPASSYLSLRDSISNFDSEQIACTKEEDKEQLLKIFRTEFQKEIKDVKEVIRQRFAKGYHDANLFLYGQRILSRDSYVYDASNKIGKGSFAQVYQGTYGNSPAAIKIVSFSELDNEQEKKKVIDDAIEEVTIMQDTLHPSILICYGLFIDHDASDIHLVLESCEETLAKFLFDSQDRQPLPLLEELTCVDILLHIGTGLKALHDRKVAHRDIKPENILGSHVDGRWKVGDFGISETTGTIGNLRRDFCYTLGYCAPECLLNPNDAQVRHNVIADIYSFACVTYEVNSRKRVWRNTPGTHPGTPLVYLKDEMHNETFLTVIDRMTLKNASTNPICKVNVPFDQRLQLDREGQSTVFCSSWRIVELMQKCGNWNATCRHTAAMCCQTLWDYKEKAVREEERKEKRGSRKTLLDRFMKENEELKIKLRIFEQGNSEEVIRPRSVLSAACSVFLTTRSQQAKEEGDEKVLREKLRDEKSNCAKLQEEVEEQSKEIVKLKHDARSAENQRAKDTASIDIHLHDLAGKQIVIDKKDESINKKEKQLQAARLIHANLQDRVEEQSKELLEEKSNRAKLQERVDGQSKEIIRLKNDLKIAEDQRSKDMASIHVFCHDLESQKNVIDDRDRSIKAKEEELLKEKSICGGLQARVKGQSQEIRETIKEVEEQTKEILKLKNDLKSAEDQRAEDKASIDRHIHDLEGKQIAIDKKDKYIKGIEEELQVLRSKYAKLGEQVHGRSISNQSPQRMSSAGSSAGSSLIAPPVNTDVQRHVGVSPNSYFARTPNPASQAAPARSQQHVMFQQQVTQSGLPSAAQRIA